MPSILIQALEVKELNFSQVGREPATFRLREKRLNPLNRQGRANFVDRERVRPLQRKRFQIGSFSYVK